MEGQGVQGLQKKQMELHHFTIVPHRFITGVWTILLWQYHLAIACEKEHERQSALRLLSKMAAAKVIANAISYSAATSARKKGQEWQLALGLLSRMATTQVIARQLALELLSKMAAAKVRAKPTMPRSRRLAERTR